MFLNVAIANNQLTDNGGVIVAPYQVNQARWNTTPPVPYLDATYRNIEIKNNVLKNTKGQWPSSINTEFFSIFPNQFWGVSADGVEVRNNQLTAHAAANPNNYFYTGNNGKEGYENENPQPAVGQWRFCLYWPKPDRRHGVSGQQLRQLPRAVRAELRSAGDGHLERRKAQATSPPPSCSTPSSPTGAPNTAGPHSTGTITNNPPLRPRQARSPENNWLASAR